MNIKDLIIIDTEAGSLATKLTSFSPNSTDEELNDYIKSEQDRVKTKIGVLGGLSDAEFTKLRNNICQGLSDDAKLVDAMANELLELRKTTRKIQEERDVLADFVMTQIFDAEPCEDPNH